MAKREPVSVKVVREVADREGTDPTELRPPLHAVVDTDALDALFRSGEGTTRTEGTVEFTYKGYPVTVDSSGTVTVTEQVPGRDRGAGDVTIE